MKTTVTIEGKMWIDKGDIDNFVFDCLDSTEARKMIDTNLKFSFSVEQNALVVTDQFDNLLHHIDAPVWWAWINEEHKTKAGLTDYEISYGVPKMIGACMLITFAGGMSNRTRLSDRTIAQ